MAPEMQGTIQDNTYTRSEEVTYTNAVDIWAVGVMTFRILTGRDPFRPGEIGEYITGKLPFPTRRLRQVMASYEACRFVQSLMTPQPHLRPNARDCLNHYWLQSRTTVPGTLERLSRSELEESGLAEDPLEASATWSSEPVSRVKTEEQTSVSDNETIAPTSAPTAFPNSPFTGKDNATENAFNAVKTKQDVTPSFQGVNATDFASITPRVMGKTEGQSRRVRSGSCDSSEIMFRSHRALEETPANSLQKERGRKRMSEKSAVGQKTPGRLYVKGEKDGNDFRPSKSSVSHRIHRGRDELTISALMHHDSQVQNGRVRAMSEEATPSRSNVLLSEDFLAPSGDSIGCARPLMVRRNAIAWY